jgi:hypothetical protein
MWLYIGWAVPLPPISVTCSKWYIRKAPCVLGAQPLGMSLLSCCRLLNKLASWKLWFPLILCSSPPVTLLEAHPGFGGWCFHLLVTGSVHPAHQEGCLCQAPPDHVDKGREPRSCWADDVSSSCTKEPGKAREPTWESCLSDVRIWVQIQACLRRQKGSLINS